VIHWEVARHQVAIAGRVTDRQTGRPIGGARVKITAGPQAFTKWLAVYALQYGDRWATMADRPDQTRTAADGHYHFLDLPDGDYTLTASLPEAGSRYGTAETQATVERDAQGNLTLTPADITLPPTTLKGRVTGQGAGPVVMAEMRMQGSGECAFTDAQGRYLLAGLETGTRTVIVSARGYQPESTAVLLSPAGIERVVNITLVP
jgi:hypothetical protein